MLPPISSATIEVLVVIGHVAEDRRDERDRHADDAVPVAAPGGFLVRQSAEREDEEDRRGDVGDGYDSFANHVDLTS